MTGVTAAPVSRWRFLATAAYFLAVLLVLSPGLGLMFVAWPLTPSRLPWRHVSSDMLIAAGPMIGAAAVGILLAAKTRGDAKILKLLRACGLLALVLSVPFIILYSRDAVLIYREIPLQQSRYYVAMEVRMFSVMAIGLALLWAFTRAARGQGGADAVPASHPGDVRKI